MRTAPSVILIVAIVSVPATLAGKDKPAQFPGQKETGFLLPNGWTITPAGEQVMLKDLPLNIVPLADNRHALVATSGYNAHELTLVDLAIASRRCKPKPCGKAGSAWRLRPAQDKLWWSGGGGAALHAFDLKDGKLARADAGDPTAKDKQTTPTRRNFAAAWRSTPSATCSIRSTSTPARCIVIDLAGKQARANASTLGGRPYDVVIARNGSRLYVSDWAGRAVLAVDPQRLARRGQDRRRRASQSDRRCIRQDDRIFVACANSNHVSVIDTKRGIVTETIFTALFPKSPEGSTPDALAVSPDGEQLFVANADNNCVAVIDISVSRAAARCKASFPPAGIRRPWPSRPTASICWSASARETRRKANPILEVQRARKDRTSRRSAAGRIRTSAPRSPARLSIVPMPDEAKLAAYTETVYRNCPYSDKLLTDAPHPEKTPFRRRSASRRRSST